jgi:hypothetical protein
VARAPDAFVETDHQLRVGAVAKLGDCATLGRRQIEIEAHAAQRGERQRKHDTLRVHFERTGAALEAQTVASIGVLVQCFQHSAGFDRVVKLVAEAVHDAVVAAAHMEAFVAFAEDAERFGTRIDEGQEIQRGLLGTLQPHLGRVGDLDQRAQPAGRAVAVQPLRHRLAVERRGTARRRVGDLLVRQGVRIACDCLGERRECAQDVVLGVAAATVEPDVAIARRWILREVVELQPQFRGERADAHVTRVDQLAAEFAHLAVGEMVAQREHAATDARLRLVHAHADPSLAQAMRAAQSGDAGADDDNVIRPGGTTRQWHARASRECERGSRDRLLQEAAPRTIDVQFALARDCLVQRLARLT